MLAEVAGVGSFDDVKRRSVEVDAFDRRILSLTIQGLIEAKRAAGRSIDLAHIHELESLLEAQEDDP